MKISIITITYNSCKTVKDTFDSVLLQDYRPLQYMVVDGCSTDGTLEIISEYKRKFEDVGIEFSYISEPDKGISDAFNKGIKNTDGELIGIINSDDMIYEGALNILAGKYNSNTDIYYGQCVIFNDNNEDKYIAFPKDDPARLKVAMMLYHPACFVRRSAYETNGLFDIDLKYCMDREFLLRCFVNNCTFLKIDSPLAFYREGGVNQKYYKKNLLEGTKISISYGMNPIKAYTIMALKYVKSGVWFTVKRIGAERLFHKKV